MSDLEPAFEVKLREHGEAEEALERQVEELAGSASGLVDIDLTLRLVTAKLSWCLHALTALSASPSSQADSRATLRAEAARRAAAALKLLEGLASANVSEDQRGQWRSGPAWEHAKELLQEFILAGGGILLEARELSARRRQAVARGIVAAIRKYAAPDDRYRAMEPDDYPPILQRIFLTFFPSLAKEHPRQPPYGIDEGEERVESSDHLLMPLSQAITYYEREELPKLRQELTASPGDPGLQAQIRSIEQKVEGYRKMRFFPRTESVLLEQGFQTATMTSYSADGELLVAVPEKAIWLSGVNTDRTMELARAELVRRLAGTGVCPELDREYRWLRSLESGMRGSSRTPRMKLDTAKGFRMLKTDYPVLARLEDRQAFRELAAMATAGSIGKAENGVSALVDADQRERPPVLALGAEGEEHGSR